MREIGRTARVLVALLLLIVASAARGQEKKLLSLRFESLSLQPRTHGPLHVDATLDWRGPGLLQGRLQLTINNGFDTVAVYRTHELALTRGEQTVRLALPPVVGGFRGATGELTAQFVSHSGEVRLGRHQLALAAPDARSLSIAHVLPDDRSESRDGLRGLLEAARLERYAPNEDAKALLSTSITGLDPQSLPASSSGFLSYDVVAIGADALRALGSEALEALDTWVRAGGSLLVLADQPIESAHLAFLNGLEAGSSPLLMADPLGRPMTVGADASSVQRLYTGLGRAVILTGDGSVRPAPGSREWRQIVGFLWKLRTQQQAALVERGGWRADLEDVSPWRANTYPYLSQGGNDGQKPPLTLAPLPMPGGHELVPALMPSNVRVVPFGLVVLILIGFTLAVGPGDYLLLGMIRRRRWTWALFPLVAVGFTLMTVLLAEGYMGRTDHRTSLTITDLDEESRPVRETRFELLFAGRSMEVASDIEGALLVPVDHNRLGAYGYYAWRNQPADTGPPTYEGRFPTKYGFVETVAQWSPKLRRSTRLIDGGRAEATLAWDAVRHADLTRPADDLSERLQAKCANGVSVFLVGGAFVGGVRTIQGVPSAALNADPNDPYRSMYVPYTQRSPDGNGPVAHGLLAQTSRLQREGFFSLVSQVSPTGGDTLEDLSLVDIEDPGAILVVAVWRDGNNVRIVRKLYREP